MSAKLSLLGGEHDQETNNNNMGEDDGDGQPHRSPSPPVFDGENQLRIAQLLKQWGANLSSAGTCRDARRMVQEHRKQNNDDELFTFNPYRPQGGQGFPGKNMWISLLSETTNMKSVEKKNDDRTDEEDEEENKEVRKRVAMIFRVDQEHNARVQTVLKEQDEKCERVINKLLTSNVAMK